MNGSDRSREYLARLVQPIEPKRGKPVSAEVKGLTDVVKDISTIKEKASQVAADLRANTANTNESLDMVAELSKALKEADAELRGALGIQTNHPPSSGG